MTDANRVIKKETFKSRGEAAIARLLSQCRIPYRYEPDLYLEDGQKRVIYHPDFYLPDYHTIIEYFGLKGHADYEQGIQKKKHLYQKNHYHLIPVYPATLQRNYETYILKSLHSHLAGRTRDLEYRLRQHGHDAYKPT